MQATPHQLPVVPNSMGQLSIYMLLIAHRYGYRLPENNPHQPPIILLEYREASRHGSIEI